ncbi:hypothetical protein NDI54_19995 [Haloarcula sp. S1AR25-5A]|uniref:Uncharacterized protein n=1 Tax=Haloarcula terrestris TaxID=2950533 RepID=A0AAE4JID9_9EURY|nr:hypothetical protein [Haloarcula terrestris]MDS0223627.1 hypothetical protein [Haloarcula terrestris]
MVTGVDSGIYSLNNQVVMSDRNTTVGLKESTKDQLEPLKKESDAASWDEFINNLAAENLDVSAEELNAQEVETHERVERTRATVVGVLEAVDEADMTDEIVDIIKSLSEQDMLAQNQEIVNHFIEKSKRGEPINEIDKLLADVVKETESERGPEQSPAAAIARGLFTETEEATAERTRTERDATVRDATVSENQSEIKSEEPDSDLFTGVEEATESSEESVTLGDALVDIADGKEDDE